MLVYTNNPLGRSAAQMAPWSFAASYSPVRCYKSAYLDLITVLCSSDKYHNNRFGAIHTCALY